MGHECIITSIEWQWLKNSSSARPLIAFLKTLNNCMFAKLSGRSFQSWTVLYEKDRWPVADLIDGIWSLYLFLVFLVCTWLLVDNLLHKDGGANPFIHLKAIKMSLTSSCLATSKQWSSFNKSAWCAHTFLRQSQSVPQNSEFWSLVMFFFVVLDNMDEQ